MKITIDKVKAILLFFANYTDNKFLGKTKMMKLIYFLDFTHLKSYGSPVTYDTYIHLEHGPIPSAIKNLVDNTADDPSNSLLADTIQVEKVKIPTGEMFRITPLREFSDRDESLFSETELDILKKVAERFGNKTTKIVEEASHDEAPWKETKEPEMIPYTLAAKDKDSLVTEEEIAALLNLVK